MIRAAVLAVALQLVGCALYAGDNASSIDAGQVAEPPDAAPVLSYRQLVIGRCESLCRQFVIVGGFCVDSCLREMTEPNAQCRAMCADFQALGGEDACFDSCSREMAGVCGG